MTGSFLICLEFRRAESGTGNPEASSPLSLVLRLLCFKDCVWAPAPPALLNNGSRWDDASRSPLLGPSMTAHSSQCPLAGRSGAPHNRRGSVESAVVAHHARFAFISRTGLQIRSKRRDSAAVAIWLTPVDAGTGYSLSTDIRSGTLHVKRVILDQRLMTHLTNDLCCPRATWGETDGRGSCFSRIDRGCCGRMALGNAIAGEKEHGSRVEARSAPTSSAG